MAIMNVVNVLTPFALQRNGDIVRFTDAIGTTCSIETAMR